MFTMLADFNLLALPLLIPSDLCKCLGLCRARLLKLKLAELSCYFFQLLCALWVGISKSTAMMPAMVPAMIPKPSRRPSRRPSSQTCKGEEDKKL